MQYADFSILSVFCLSAFCILQAPFLSYPYQSINTTYMRYNILYNKAMLFSVRIIHLARFLKNSKKEAVLANQILKSGTSIAANVAEAIGAITKADFSAKISLSFKEAKETKLWIELLLRSNCITRYQYDSITKDCEEILRILWTILRRTRNELRD